MKQRFTGCDPNFGFKFGSKAEAQNSDRHQILAVNYVTNSNFTAATHFPMINPMIKPFQLITPK